jgi:hypothetical protein
MTRTQHQPKKDHKFGNPMVAVAQHGSSDALAMRARTAFNIFSSYVRNRTLIGTRRAVWQAKRFAILPTKALIRPRMPLPATPVPRTGCSPAYCPRSAGSVGASLPSAVGPRIRPFPSLAEE